jgi:digeranylgeranylglycerophospholipid reductase
MSRPMLHDALVVGGGPAGLFAARELSRCGFSVVLCEEHERVGDPVHCTGVLGVESFDEFAVPRTSILNALETVRMISPAGISVGYSPRSIEAVVIDRRAFDESLAEQARAAGADLRPGTRVTSLAIETDGIRALAGDAAVRARIGILACGASYGFQRRLGLGMPQAYLQTAQRELPAARPGDVELHFGSSAAPGGFAWAVPVVRPDGGYVRVGVMASQDAAACYEQMVARLAPAWGISDRAEAPRQKILPLGPIERTFDDRLLVVGDAAGLVKPTTGGGIYYSLISAAIAADVAADALRTGRLDASELSEYEARWRGRIGAELDAQASLRRVSERLTDTEIDALFDLARTDGIMPLVRKTAQFNQHRHLIKALFKHPPVRKVLFRSLTS